MIVEIEVKEENKEETEEEKKRCDWFACQKEAIIDIIERRKDKKSGFVYKERKALCHRHFSKMHRNGTVDEIIAYLYKVVD